LCWLISNTETEIAERGWEGEASREEGKSACSAAREEGRRAGSCCAVREERNEKRKEGRATRDVSAGASAAENQRDERCECWLSGSRETEAGKRGCEDKTSREESKSAGSAVREEGRRAGIAVCEEGRSADSAV